MFSLFMRNPYKTRCSVLPKVMSYLAWNPRDTLFTPGLKNWPVWKVNVMLLLLESITGRLWLPSTIITLFLLLSN